MTRPRLAPIGQRRVSVTLDSEALAALVGLLGVRRERVGGARAVSEAS